MPYSEYRATRNQVNDKLPLSSTQTSRNGSGKGKNEPSAPAPNADLVRLSSMNAHQLSKERQRAKSRLEEAEGLVAKLEEELTQIIAALSRPSDQAVELAKRHGEVEEELFVAVEEWEKAQTYADLVAGM